jgi:hypothetical protein
VIGSAVNESAGRRRVAAEKVEKAMVELEFLQEEQGAAQGLWEAAVAEAAAGRREGEGKGKGEDNAQLR